MRTHFPHNKTMFLILMFYYLNEYLNDSCVMAADTRHGPCGAKGKPMLYHDGEHGHRARHDKNNTSVLLCGIVKLHPLQPPHTLSKTNKEET